MPSSLRLSQTLILRAQGSSSSSSLLLTSRANHRAFHASSTRKDMVAPPDPISHMRPVIYDNPASAIPPSNVLHPYSLSEFTSTGADAGAPGDYELQFGLMRQQLDALHQNFWLDSNTRFYSARESVLQSLPQGATARDKEEALSAFFRQWVMQEKEWTDNYTTEWRMRNFQLITLGARVEFQKLKTRLSSIFKSP